MTTIKVLRTTFARGKLLEAGKTYEVEDKVAKDLVTVKKAEVAMEKPPQKQSAKKRSAKGVGGVAQNTTESDATSEGDPLPLKG